MRFFLLINGSSPNLFFSGVRRSSTAPERISVFLGFVWFTDTGVNIRFSSIIHLLHVSMNIFGNFRSYRRALLLQIRHATPSLWWFCVFFTFGLVLVGVGSWSSCCPLSSSSLSSSLFIHVWFVVGFLPFLILSLWCFSFSLFESSDGVAEMMLVVIIVFYPGCTLIHYSVYAPLGFCFRVRSSGLCCSGSTRRTFTLASCRLQAYSWG